MKILWFSNKFLQLQDNGITGTWLNALSEKLANTDQIQLGNITAGNVRNLERSDFGRIKQWVVPGSAKINKNGLPNNKIINFYLTAINDFKPDLIHVWGSESYSGLITARKLTTLPTLLEIQGSKASIARVYNGYLSIYEQILSIGIREILRKSTIFQQKKKFTKWTEFEDEIMSNHINISAPSKWMEAQVTAINPKAILFKNEIILRDLFYTCKKWQFSGKPTIFMSAAYSAPFKGFHIAIRAILILKKKYPDIQLRIAGFHKIKGIRRDGYINLVRKEIKRSNLDTNVIWLGALDGSQIVNELTNCSVVLLPSYIESYGLAHAEAMAVGSPCVCSFNGGSAYLAEDEKTSLFFPPGDYIMCSYQIERLLKDEVLAQSISGLARNKILLRNDPEKIVNQQIQIYRKILNI